MLSRKLSFLLSFDSGSGFDQKVKASATGLKNWASQAGVAIPKAFRSMKSAFASLDTKIIEKLGKGAGINRARDIFGVPTNVRFSPSSFASSFGEGAGGGGGGGRGGGGGGMGLPSSPLDPFGWSARTKQVVAFGTAMHALLYRGAELSDSMLKVSLRTEESADNYRKFGSLAISSMADAKSSITEVFEVYMVLAKNQIRGEQQLLKYANTSLKLANVTGLNAGRAASLAVTYDKITKGRGNFEAFASVFVRLHSTTRATAEELANLVDKAEELSLFLPRIGKDFTTSLLSAGAAMKDLFGDPTSLIDAFQEAQQLSERGMKIRAMLAGVGVDFESVRGNVEDFTVAFARAVQNVPRENLQQLGDTYADIFGVDKVTLLRIHGAELGKITEQFERTRRAAADSAELDRRWSDSLSSFTDQFSVFRTQLWNLVRQFGAPMVSMIAMLLRPVNWLLGTLNKLLDLIPNFAKGFLGFVVLGGLAAKTLAAAFGGVSAALLLLRGGIGLLGLDIAKIASFSWGLLTSLAVGIKGLAITVWGAFAAAAPAAAAAISGAFAAVGTAIAGAAAAAAPFLIAAGLVYGAMAAIGGVLKFVSWGFEKLSGIFDAESWPKTHKVLSGIGNALDAVGTRLIKPWKLFGDVKRLFGWLTSDGAEGAKKTERAFKAASMSFPVISAAGAALKAAGKGAEWLKGMFDPNASPRVYRALDMIERSFKKSGDYLMDPTTTLGKLWESAKAALGIKDKAPPPPQRVGPGNMTEQMARSRVLATERGSWAPGKALLEGLRRGDSERDLLIQWKSLAQQNKEFTDYLQDMNPGKALGHVLRDEFYREYEKMQQALATVPEMRQPTTGQTAPEAPAMNSRSVDSLRVLKDSQESASLNGASAVVTGLTPLLRTMIDILSRQETRFGAGRSPVVDVDENLIRTGIL